ncbi:MAG TPA: hypothetical protein VNG12_24695 [Acidimicrobiales bacterium]|nr:hypothetical protein [Acidimicrobiales bacterium]
MATRSAVAALRLFKTMVHYTAVSTSISETIQGFGPSKTML